MEFKCRLKIIFAERNIKQGDFAKKVGLSPAGISAIVNNHTLPSFTVVYLICEELGLPIQEIWMKVEE